MGVLMRPLPDGTPAARAITLSDGSIAVLGPDPGDCCCGPEGCGPERIKIRIAGTLSVLYVATTNSSEGDSSTTQINLTVVIPGAEMTLDRVQAGNNGGLYAARPECELTAHGRGTYTQDALSGNGFRNLTRSQWGTVGGVGPGLGITVFAEFVDGVCSIRTLNFDLFGYNNYSVLRTAPDGSVLTEFDDIAEEPVFVSIPYVAQPFVGTHSTQDFSGDYFGAASAATISGGAFLFPDVIPALAAPATRVVEDNGVTVTTQYVSVLNVPTLTVTDHEGMPAVCAADHVVEAELCGDPDAPRIVVDLRDALSNEASLPVFQSEVYLPTDVATGPPVDTRDWQPVTCEPDAIDWPVYAACADSAQTRLVDDTDKPVDAQTAIFAGARWFDTGQRQAGTPDVPDDWDTQGCPSGGPDTPQFQLCGTLPSGFDDSYRRLYWANATDGVQYLRTTVQRVIPNNCIEYWDFTYERAENLSGPYIVPLGLAGASACAPPDFRTRICDTGDGVFVQPDRDETGGQQPSSTGGRFGDLPTGADAEELRRQTQAELRQGGCCDPPSP